MESRSLGVFAEASPALVLASEMIPGDPLLRERRFGGLLFTGWAGGHLPIGPSAAFLAGPTAGWLEDLKRFGDRGTGYLGFRMGTRVFVP